MKFTDISGFFIAEDIAKGTSSVSEIEHSNTELLSQFCDFYNESGQLSWQLNPTRLLSKLGSSGKAYALLSEGVVVGTIGLKEHSAGGLDGAEIGYFMVDPEYRSFKAALSLFNATKEASREFDYVMSTTNVNNTTINRLSEHSKFMQLAFEAKSPFSSNRLNYWVSTINNGSHSIEEVIEVLSDEYGD